MKSPRRHPRAQKRGMTLIEITIALAIAALAVGTAVISLNALTDAALKSGAIELTGAIKYSYDRSIMEKRTQRLGMDIDKGLWWLDFTDDPYALAKERAEGEAGERPEDKEGKDIDDLDSLFSGFDADGDMEVKRAMEGGKASRFMPDSEVGKPKPLPSGVKFSKVWTGHQEEPFKTGVAYLHFFRSGWTEPAQIELTDGDEFITLKVFPLTGRVRMYPKQLDDPDVDDDDGRDEGDL